MQTKNLLIAIAGLVIVVGGAFVFMGSGKDQTASVAGGDKMTLPTPSPTSAVVEDNTVTGAGTPATNANIKEFSMTAYYDAGGKWFSLKEMSVKKGDTVRVKITNTKGMHDFTIDEFGVKKQLPLNQEVVVEFIPDKVGDFVYYCSMPGHRAGGQWGTLHVTE